MVGRTAKRGRASPTPGRTPSSARSASPAARSSSRNTPRKTGGAPAGGALTLGNATGTAPAGATPGVAEMEALVQAINLLPTDIRRLLAAREGVPPPPSSSVATFRYDDARLEGFYEQRIAPFIPEQLQADIEAVEWSVNDQLFTRACHSVELRKPGEDGAIKDMLRDMWYEQRLDARSKPQPAHVLDLLKKKPA